MAGTDPGCVNTAACPIPLHNFPSLLLCTKSTALCFVSLALSMGEFDLGGKKEKKAHTVEIWLVACCEWYSGMPSEFEFASKCTEYIKLQLLRTHIMFVCVCLHLLSVSYIYFMHMKVCKLHTSWADSLPHLESTLFAYWIRLHETNSRMIRHTHLMKTRQNELLPHSPPLLHLQSCFCKMISDTRETSLNCNKKVQTKEDLFISDWLSDKKLSERLTFDFNVTLTQKNYTVCCKIFVSTSIF